MRLRLLSLAVLPFLAACGSSEDSTFLDALPSYDALAMDMTGSDATPPANALSEGLSQPLLGIPCHPHLFIRTHEVAARMNRHLHKFLGRIDQAYNRRADIATDTTRVWERTRLDGTTIRLTITKTSDQVFTWAIDLKAAGGADFVPIFTGSIDRSSATGPHQGTGSLTLDLTALHGVVDSERATGIVSASFAVTDSSRKMIVDANNVAWEVEPVMPDGSAMPADVEAGLESPRNAHYVYFREPGKGGSLKIADQMIFLCPDNPSFKRADVDVITRWYRLADGALHGRSDALMTGGQLPDHNPVIARIEGVTCYQGTAEREMPAEKYWMMKGEAQDGSTIAGLSYESSGESPCDSVFGDVPLIDNSSQDFDFAAVDFTSDESYPFPGM